MLDERQEERIRIDKQLADQALADRIRRISDEIANTALDQGQRVRILHGDVKMIVAETCKALEREQQEKHELAMNANLLAEQARKELLTLVSEEVEMVDTDTEKTKRIQTAILQSLDNYFQRETALGVGEGSFVVRSRTSSHDPG